MSGMPTAREALRKLVFAMATKDVVELTDLYGSEVSAGGSVDKVVEIPDYKSNMAIEVRVTYNSNAISGGRLFVYYSSDNVNFDTDTDQYVNLPFAQGQTKQQTFMFPAISKYVKIVIVNDDENYSFIVDSVKVIFF